ncbi:hypothetical protein [Dermacoccus barathri]|uniref:DUF3800 domain-containing protein n=1 Tax=Dermacoccus abyssi TaxID=322596 RepID=A0ABX5ZG27_9MICO|nr:hypothetical protein [Dermacoccus barathri]MBE7372925.1 hypothetical protein [Dermacoccus barathri]QEH94825.1 hypothetical protein FV141_14480 [Dermacoccus abyssi]
MKDQARGGHAYLDESTQGDYLVIASVIAPGDVREARAALRGLLLPRQRSLHMKDEKKTARQDLIVATVCNLELTTTIYVAKPSEHKGHTGARDACIQRASSDSATQGVQRLVLDRNDSYMKRDEASILKGATRAGVNPVPFNFGHMSRHEEPMLWVPDVLGWCYARGGTWRHRVHDHVRIIAL